MLAVLKFDRICTVKKN